MKVKQLVAWSILLGLQDLAHATTYPADAETRVDLSALETHADSKARVVLSDSTWAVSKCELGPHNPFSGGGGNIDHPCHSTGAP